MPEDGAEATDDGRRVACYRTRPGRCLFAEADSTDAWIATDVTVDCEP